MMFSGPSQGSFNIPSASRIAQVSLSDRTAVVSKKNYEDGNHCLTWAEAIREHISIALQSWLFFSQLSAGCVQIGTSSSEHMRYV